MKKMSKNNTTEVERTEYPWKKETQEEIKTPSLTEKRGGGIKLAATRRRWKIVQLTINTVLSQYYFGDRNMISPSSLFSSAKIEKINWHSSKSLHFSSGKKKISYKFSL